MSLIFKFNENLNVTGKLLKEYRLKNNLSYEMLSTKLALMGIDISKPSLHKLETGHRILKDYELFGISMVFKVPIEDFISDFMDNLKKENIV